MSVKVYSRLIQTIEPFRDLGKMRSSVKSVSEGCTGWLSLKVDLGLK